MILTLSSRLVNDRIIYSHSLFQLALFSSGPRDIYLSQAKTGRYRMVMLSVGVCKQKTAAVLGCFLTLSDGFSCTRKAIRYSVKISYPKPEN